MDSDSGDGSFRCCRCLVPVGDVGTVYQGFVQTPEEAPMTPGGTSEFTLECRMTPKEETKKKGGRNALPPLELGNHFIDFCSYLFRLSFN